MHSNNQPTPVARRKQKNGSALTPQQRIRHRELRDAVIYAARDCKTRMARRWRVDAFARPEQTVCVEVLSDILADLANAGADRDELHAILAPLTAQIDADTGAVRSLDLVPLLLAETRMQGIADPAQDEVKVRTDCPNALARMVATTEAHARKLMDIAKVGRDRLYRITHHQTQRGSAA